MEGTREIVQGWKLSTDKIVVLARHESSMVNMADRQQVLEYAHGRSDPGLSEQGLARAKATVTKLPVAIRIKPDWRCGGSKRALQTAYIYAGQEVSGYKIDTAFNPANYDQVPETVIDQWLEKGDDKILYNAWMQTDVYKSQGVAVIQRIGEIVQEVRHIVGIVTHDEICRLIMAFFLCLRPENFVKDECRVIRGEIVVMRVFPDGNVEVKRTS